MNESNTNENASRNSRPTNRRGALRFVLIVLVVVVAGIGGIMVGERLSDTRDLQDDQGRIDDYVGLGERTGLTGDVSLLVEPARLTITSGQEVKVNLILVNNGSKELLLNGFFTPAPADLDSNQLPIKVSVTRDGRRVAYQGSGVVFPSHKKEDFIALRAGGRKKIEVDLSRGPGGGVWNISSPGNYLFEVWYETYLTGRHIGVNAWTGMTNHVVVQVNVLPQQGGPS